VLRSPPVATPTFTPFSFPLSFSSFSPHLSTSFLLVFKQYKLLTCLATALLLVILDTTSVSSSPVRPSSRGGRGGIRLLVLLPGALGRTIPGEVRTGRTSGDYSPSAWTPALAKLKSYTLQESFWHHETSLMQSPAVSYSTLESPATPYHLPPSTTPPPLIMSPTVGPALRPKEGDPAL